MSKEFEIFKPVRERLSNPFIFSYILAWLIFNWMVVLGLMKYSIQDLGKDGFNSFIDLVRRGTSNWTLYWGPLISATAYTFLFPPFRNCVLAFQAWAKKWGTGWNLRISKGGKVPVEKYLGLRSDYLARIKILEEVLKSESGFIDKNKQLTEDIENTRKEIQELRDILAQITFLCNPISYNGDWDVTSSNGSNSIRHHFRFEQGNMILVSEGTEKVIYSIGFIGYNPSSKHISMTFHPQSGAPSFGVVFQQSPGMTNLKSTNGNTSITAMAKR